jgi:cell wall assembly regulator SMI1
MLFENQDKPMPPEEIDSIEAELGICFPNSLKNLFLENNGGSPIPYVLRTQSHHTTISETLPLKSAEGRGTAVDTYKSLVLGRNLVSRQLFPFAVDSGGDYFFIDCTPNHESIYFYKADSTFNRNLSDLCMSLDAFWNSLIDEE